MKHYIDTNNKIYGFGDDQVGLVPIDAVLISTSFDMDQIPCIELVNGTPKLNQSAYDAKKAKEQTVATNKINALAKLAALGLTPEEITSLIG
jgi:hypothetical protein